MLTGKFWITPEGLIDVTMTEHALVARRVMLGLAPDEPRFTVRNMFKALSPEEQAEFRARGVPEDALSFLEKEPNEPRIFMIRERGWIRVRASGFYIWTMDAATLQRILGAQDFWRAQTKFDPYEALNFHVLSTHSACWLTARQLKEAPDAATAWTWAKGQKYLRTIETE